MTPDVPAPANGTIYSASHLQLAALLRECANYVERNEFHPDMHQALGLFHAYTAQHSSSGDEHRQVSKAPATATMDPIHVMSSLGKGLKKGLGLAEPQHHKPSRVVNQGAAQETSSKNAERARADLGDLARKAERGNRSKNEHDWCNEHFCLGCACKDHLKTSASSSSSTIEQSASRGLSPVQHDPSAAGQRDTSRVNVTTATSAATAATSRPANKPSFQRPVNPNSILIANGWIEQQRRSKMRVVWKDVLASLVEGRKPGEETTLWIQRETTNQVTGKPELEALHQIPMKWLVSIEYLDYATDHRFALKVHNVAEEFLFKCADDESAQNWVLTLRSVREITLKNAKGNHAPPPKNEVEEWGETVPPVGEQVVDAPRELEQDNNSHRMSIHELRAIAHGAGISTAGMERKELEAAVMSIAGSAQSDTAREDQSRREEELRKRQEREAELRRRQAVDAEEAEQRRRMVEENEKHRKIAEEEEHRMRMEQEKNRRQAAEEEQRRRKLVEEEQRRRQQQAEEEARRKKQAEEAQRTDEMRRRQLAEEELRRRAAEEEQRRRAAEQQAAEKEQRRRAAEEEQRRRAAEQQAAEQRRREEAQRQQWQQQQRQQAAAAAEQQATEQRRRQEEAQRQQQWQQQQRQQQQWQQRQPPPQQPPPQNWQNPPQQQPFYGGPRAASPSGQAPPQPQRGQGPTSSPINLKYAKMAAQNDDGGQATMTAIKHNILVHWALQPPRLQMLRPIDVLISTIHTVFPPVFNVPGHDYFSNWQPVKREDLIGPGNTPEEEKLKKGVRKLRFFLHPDKRPRDLTDEQTFMCKMLWDITSDAWDDFQKHKEELDWIR